MVAFGAQPLMLLILKVPLMVPSSPARGPFVNVKSQGPPLQAAPESPVNTNVAAGVEVEPFPIKAIWAPVMAGFILLALLEKSDVKSARASPPNIKTPV